MTTTTVSGKARSSGCGCGGGGGSSSGCGGGCSGSARPTRGTAFVRPRFFGGMLLTEDDLQTIDDYMLAKRRLTNRSVFGAGVVCGLDVDCDPCSTTHVVVNPGYALDCCGNDIVVECDEKVDIAALVRELRARQGVDCGEPCDDDGPTRSYVLNLVYAEEQTEPVAPYAADDCATGDCEFSRVREGYRFELSCDAPDPETNVIDEVRRCLKAILEDGDEDARAMARLVEISRHSTAAEDSTAAPAEVLRGLEVPKVAAFAPFEVDEPELQGAVALVSRSIALLADDEAHRAGRESLAPRFNATRRGALETHTKEVAARALASRALQELPAERRERVEPVLVTARDQQGLDRLSVEERAFFASGAYDKEDGTQEWLREGPRLQARVLHGLEQSRRRGCRDYADVAGLRFDRFDASAEKSATVLARVYLSLIARCLCNAANPPCPTCTDAQVPIARVDVNGCDVVGICTLERRWVHSPRALAYWFPVVEAVRELLEERCCPSDRAYEQKRTVVRELDKLQLRAVESAMVMRPTEDRPEMRNLMTTLGDQFVTRLGGSGVASAASAAVSSGAGSSGAPSPGTVTVDRADWEKLLARIEKLEATR